MCSKECAWLYVCVHACETHWGDSFRAPHYHLFFQDQDVCAWLRKRVELALFVPVLRGWLGWADKVEAVSVKRVTMALWCCGVRKPRRAQAPDLLEGGPAPCCWGAGAPFCLWRAVGRLAGALSSLLRDSVLGQVSFPLRSIRFLEYSTPWSSLWNARKGLRARRSRAFCGLGHQCVPRAPGRNSGGLWPPLPQLCLVTRPPCGAPVCLRQSLPGGSLSLGDQN